MKYEIRIPETDLNLEHCLRSGQVFRFEQIEGGRWIGVDGDAWFLISREGGSVIVESNQPQTAFERLMRLDWDAEDVTRQILSLGPEMAPYLECLHGHRLLRPSDPVEVFFCFMCSANNHISRIGQMIRKLASFGEPLAEVEGRTLTVFPTCEVIATIPEMRLRELGFGYRGKSIPIAARQMEERGGAEWLTSLKSAPYEAAHKELIPMYGIGAKLADCILLFGLGHDDVIPIDTHIWQALTRLYFPDWADKPVTAQRYREASTFFRDRFGQLAGWAHQYLFYENVLNWRSR